MTTIATQKQIINDLSDYFDDHSIFVDMMPLFNKYKKIDPVENPIFKALAKPGGATKSSLSQVTQMVELSKDLKTLFTRVDKDLDKLTGIFKLSEFDTDKTEDLKFLNVVSTLLDGFGHSDISHQIKDSIINKFRSAFPDPESAVSIDAYHSIIETVMKETLDSQVVPVLAQRIPGGMPALQTVLSLVFS